MNAITCETARARLLDALLGAPTDPAEWADAERHAATCAACRAEMQDLRETWKSLRIAPDPLPSPDGRERARRALVSAMLEDGIVAPAPTRPPRTSRFAMAGALAATLLAGVALGRTSAPSRAATAAATTVVPRAGERHFMILLYTAPSTRPRPTSPPSDSARAAAAARMRAIIAEYRAWADDLAREGRLIRAEKLEDESRLLPAGLPDARGGALLGGFYLIYARDLDDAERIARESPHLKYGGRVVVRGIEGT